MKWITLVGFWGFAFSPCMVLSEVRTVFVSDQRMAPVFLKMGHSTVLRFSEKPKKVVVGNRNYFAIEFIDHDLTIQPQAQVKTNLFVYTEFRVYGFKLIVSGQRRQDDLLKIKWKSRVRQRQKAPKKKTQRSLNEKFQLDPRNLGPQKRASKGLNRKEIGQGVALVLYRIEKIDGLRIFDFILNNNSQESVTTKDIDVELSQLGKKVMLNDLVFEKDVVPKGQSSRVRFFVRSLKKRRLRILVTFKGSRAKRVIRGNLL